MTYLCRYHLSLSLFYLFSSFSSSVTFSLLFLSRCFLFVLFVPAVFILLPVIQKQRERERDMTFSQVSADTSSNGAEIPLVVSFGEMLIDFVPDIAGVSLAESIGFIKAPGGAPANVAVAITKLGGRSAFIGKVSFSSLSFSCLSSVHVHTFCKYVVVTAGAVLHT